MEKIGVIMKRSSNMYAEPSGTPEELDYLVSLCVKGVITPMICMKSAVIRRCDAL